MKTDASVAWGVLVLFLAVAGHAVWAGPLDRYDSGPRYNPETSNMLRVPGVIGLDYQSAVAALQQAGLNPRIHFIRHSERRYRGRAGEVVEQIPSAGGVAMLGASVTLKIYQPRDAPPPSLWQIAPDPAAPMGGASGDSAGGG
jgi:hypothetical protein